MKGVFVKGLMLLLLVSVSVSFGASYRQHVAWIKYNNNDSTAVTIQERIDQSIKENCAKLLDGTLAKSALTNYSQFTDNQMIEFAMRAVVGSMYDRLIAHYAKQAQLDANGLNITDTQLDNTFKAVVWSVIKLIGTGVL